MFSCMRGVLVELSIAASFTGLFGGDVLGVFGGGVFAGGVFSVFAGGVFAGIAFVPVIMKCLNGIHINSLNCWFQDPPLA